MPRFVRVNGGVVKARTNYQIQSNTIKHTQIRPNTNNTPNTRKHRKFSSWLPGFVRVNGVVVKARTNYLAQELHLVASRGSDDVDSVVDNMII